MRLRLMAGLLALAGVLMPTALRADEAPAPSIVLKFKSIDGLLKDARYLAELAGQGEELKQFDQMLKDFATDQGIGGIDTTKPLGLYGSISPGIQDSPIVVLLPIADEKAFVQFLASFDIKPERGDDGIYVIDNIPQAPIPVSLYFRIDGGYAHITIEDKANVAKDRLLAPAQVLNADDAVVSLTARLADLPDILKQIALQQIDNMIAEAKEPMEGESPAITQLRVQAIELLGRQITAVINDGESLAMRFGVDSAKDDITMEMAFKAKDGTPLAKDMETMGKGQSLFAGLRSDTDAVSMIGHIRLPEELKKALAPAVDEMIKQVVDGEEDQIKQTLLKAALERLAPTLKAGELDGGLSVRGPDKDGHFTVVGGLRVKEGKAIESFIKDAVKNLPEADREKIAIDADSAGSAKIHKIIIDDMDEEIMKVLGSKAVYLAMRDDAAIVGLGPDALTAVKSAAMASAGSTPMMSLTVSTSRAAGLMKLEGLSEQTEKASRQVFGANPKGNDTVIVSAEMGPTMTMRVKVKGKVIAFAAQSAGLAEAEEAKPDK